MPSIKCTRWVFQRCDIWAHSSTSSAKSEEKRMFSQAIPLQFSLYTEELQLQKEQHFIARKIWYNVSASGGNGVNLADVCSVSGTLSYATCHAVAVSQCDNILPLLSWWLAFFATSISRSYQSTGFMALFNVPHSSFSKLPHYNFICYGHWCDTYFDFFFLWMFHFSRFLTAIRTLVASIFSLVIENWRQGGKLRV